MAFQKQISLTTQHHHEMHDLTDAIQGVVRESGVHTGIAHVCNIGSTAAIGIIEFEPGLQKDFPALLEKLMPPSRAYGHEQTWHDGNGHSHLQATLLGQSLTLAVGSGKLLLGTWQQVFHIECDTRGRSRNIAVTVIGDSDA